LPVSPGEYVYHTKRKNSRYSWKKIIGLVQKIKKPLNVLPTEHTEHTEKKKTVGIPTAWGTNNGVRQEAGSTAGKINRPVRVSTGLRHFFPGKMHEMTKIED